MAGGIDLQIWTGKSLVTPSPLLANHFEELTMESNEDGTSGVSMTILSGRSGPESFLGDIKLESGSVDPGTRMALIVLIRGIPQVLFNGFISALEYSVGGESGEGRIFIKGVDASYFMGNTTRNQTYRGFTESMIAARVIAQYARFGLVPRVDKSPVETRSGTQKEFDVQARETDLSFINRLAKRLGFIFSIDATAPGISQGVFVKPSTFGRPQPTITAAMLAGDNTQKVKITNEPALAEQLSGYTVDRKTGRKIPIQGFGARPGFLASSPTLLSNSQLVKRSLLDPARSNDYSRASAQAVGEQNKSADKAVSGTTLVDTSRYGSILKARQIVGLRGVGVTNDGLYRLNKVTHTLKEGSYTQAFTIQRDGTGTTTPIVRVV